MLDYLKSILPRIQQYSKKLDDEANFVDIPWAFIDGEGENITYIFRKNKELLVSKQGDVVIGKWEYLPVMQSLLIEYEGKRRLYNQGFIDDAVMVLRKDGTNELFPLTNTQILPVGDIVSYLEREVARQIPSRSDTVSPPPEKKGDIRKVYFKKIGKYALLVSDRQPGSSSYNGCKVLLLPEKVPPPDGAYQISEGEKIQVENGEVVHTYLLDSFEMVILIISIIAIVGLMIAIAASS
jgi:hypothetical protein